MTHKYPQGQSGKIHTVHSLAQSDPAFTVGGLRWDIFQRKDKLVEAGAIFYNGKKLMIDRDRYIEFLKQGGV